MKKLGAISAAIGFSVMLAALSFADTAPTANKWRIELDGQAVKTGEIQFRVTPRQGETTDVTVSIRAGRAENNVAKDVRDAFAAKLSPDRYTIEVDDGEDILIKKKDGQPDFALELVESSVRNVNIKVEGE
jgi:sarcosine oxidase gamma subunit